MKRTHHGPLKVEAATRSVIERRSRLVRGRWAELGAAVLLMLKGYRILARRLRTRAGEIDIVARRGNHIVFVEVKRRATMAEAEAALTPAQGGRIARAGDLWLSRSPRLAALERRIDAVLVCPWTWPRHLEAAL